MLVGSFIICLFKKHKNEANLSNRHKKEECSGMG